MAPAARSPSTRAGLPPSAPPPPPPSPPPPPADLPHQGVAPHSRARHDPLAGQLPRSGRAGGRERHARGAVQREQAAGGVRRPHHDQVRLPLAQDGGDARRVGPILERDARHAQRDRSTLAQQVLQLRRVLRRARHQNARPRERHARFGAGSPSACDRAASSSGAPPLSSSASATLLPSASGSAAGPRRSARTTLTPPRPSGPPRSARSQIRSPSRRA